eukprot:356200-Chlamydomonas_euryale.AAC.3
MRCSTTVSHRSTAARPLNTSKLRTRSPAGCAAAGCVAGCAAPLPPLGMLPVAAGGVAPSAEPVRPSNVGRSAPNALNANASSRRMETCRSEGHGRARGSQAGAVMADTLQPAARMSSLRNKGWTTVMLFNGHELHNMD